MSLREIRDRLEMAEREAGRAPGSVRLIAVSKKQPEARIEAVLAGGHRTFGENRVQEAAGRWLAHRERHGDLDLHLVGPLQTNKVRQAMDLFDAIHSVDRERLARKIAEEAQARGRCPALFVQVNTGEEEQKAGVPPREAAAFVETCRAMDLTVAGLMCIPPLDEEPALHFALLAEIARDAGVEGLSMGMSADFETAVAFGATHVRVGSAIFGARPGD